MTRQATAVRFNAMWQWVAAYNWQVVVVVLLLALSSLAICGADPIEVMHEKLEAYAKGQQVSSGLTLDDMKGALDEWNELDDELKQQARQIPLIRLTVDFVIHPMEVMGYQIEADEPEHVRLFIERAQKAYKLFRSAYAEGGTFKGSMVKADNFFKILNVAAGKLPVELLTVEDFQWAKQEFEDWTAQMEQVTWHEDIYSAIPHLKKLFNYFNDPFMKALSEGVFPHVNPDSNPEELLELFYKELQERENIVLHDGQWTKFI